MPHGSAFQRAERVSYKHLPADQREEVRRARNAEAAKRSRLRKKNESREIQQAYEHNERKIANLEHMVTLLSQELNNGR